VSRHRLTPHVAPRQECSNPNVVRYFGSFVGREFLWSVMEYCGGGAQPRAAHGASVDA
jgi:serine/threonine protein kinase